ncbi:MULTISPECIES: Kiwa anti-phage protein KwaB-like domain-containing protein [unclassified Xenorhabdus]|uniref:Kiwa anti-phage protein KwaB-like domain-containing protein n=1 Tax=Xenorhabdus TaxID=626 RepID=UPI0030F48AD4
MELFAITDTGKIVKILTDAQTQISVTSLFKRQKDYFENNYTTSVEFSGGYITSPAEYFCIDNFDDVIGVLDAIQTPDSIQEWSPQDISIFNIKALFSGEIVSSGAVGNIKAYLQCFDKRQIIDNKKTIFHSILQDDNTFKLSDSDGLVIDNKLTAILENDKLKFKSFHMLRRIFDVDGYFKEATDDDLREFANHEHFHISSDFDLTNIADTVIRKKVSLINKSRVLEDYTVDDLLSIAKVNDVTLDLEIYEDGGEKKITMPQEKKHIKRLLSFLDEDYFTSQITRTLYQTNSKKKVKIT